jgi:hypothetical protein
MPADSCGLPLLFVPRGFNTQEPACAGELQGEVVDFGKKSFKGVLRIFLYHTEHEPYQLLERHFTIPAEILFSFL